MPVLPEPGMTLVGRPFTVAMSSPNLGSPLSVMYAVVCVRVCVWCVSLSVFVCPFVCVCVCMCVGVFVYLC